MSELAFEVRGNGFPVILLHGFPMNRQVWFGFAGKLANHFKIYTVDLPGFGESPAMAAPFSIDQVAKKVLDWIEEQAITKSVLIGHSLGGYVALAMTEQAPQKFTAIGLFHSTAWADTQQKKQSRDKVIEFVNTNGAVAFTSNFIAPLFADQHHPAIPMVRELSASATVQAVTGYTRAMRDRPDRTSVLKSFTRPILFIAGEKDAGIPVESLQHQAAQCLYPELHILKNVGHMGMVEDENQTLQMVRAFIEKNQKLSFAIFDF